MTYNIGDKVKIKDKYIKYMYKHLYKLWNDTGNSDYLFAATDVKERNIYTVHYIQPNNSVTHSTSIVLKEFSLPVDITLIELLKGDNKPKTNLLSWMKTEENKNDKNK